MSADQAEIASLNSQIASYQSQVSSLETQVNQLQSEIASEEALVTIADDALANSFAENIYSNYQFTAPAGDYEYFPVTSGSTGGYFFVGLVSSTSSNTLVSSTLPTGSINLGSGGVYGFYASPSSTFQIRFQDQNLSSFTATINVWYFYN